MTATRLSKKARIEVSSKAKQVKKSPQVQAATVSAKGKEKETAGDSQPSSTFKVVAGSYEKLLYGLEGSVTVEDSKPKFHLKPIFIFPAHVSCIKAVAASPGGGKWLATGSADEIVKVWDLRRRKEIGGLMHHEGSITHLYFPSRSHLLSASEDGTLCLFRARDWSVLRALKGHKGRVNSVAVHPSGKVALSVGKDKTLRMWDLMRGKGSASTKLGKEAEVVRWSSTGSLFVVLAQSVIDVYSTDVTLLHTIRHPSRLHDVKFYTRSDGSEVLLVSAEDKKVSVYAIFSDPERLPTVVATLVGHSNRVKAVDTLRLALPAGASSRSTTIACTVSSDGFILLFDLAELPSNDAKDIVELSPVAKYDSNGTRLTCLALAEGEAVEEATGKKRKHKDEEDHGDSGVEEEGWASQGEQEQEDEDEDEDKNEEGESK